MSKIINLYGGPGVGKSTTAAGLFYKMKIAGYSCELAYEWIKLKVYENTPYPFNDQIYTFGKQHKQIKQLMNKVDYIITDSPLLLSLVYGEHESDEFKELVKTTNNSYDNYHFVLERNHEYSNYGRLQNEQEANDIHSKIISMLNDNSILYIKVNSTNAADIIFDIIRGQREVI